MGAFMPKEPNNSTRRLMDVLEVCFELVGEVLGYLFELGGEAVLAILEIFG